MLLSEYQAQIAGFKVQRVGCRVYCARQAKYTVYRVPEAFIPGFLGVTVSVHGRI